MDRWVGFAIVFTFQPSCKNTTVVILCPVPSVSIEFFPQKHLTRQNLTTESQCKDRINQYDDRIICRQKGQQTPTGTQVHSFPAGTNTYIKHTACFAVTVPTGDGFRQYQRYDNNGNNRGYPLVSCPPRHTTKLQQLLFWYR